MRSRSWLRAASVPIALTLAATACGGGRSDSGGSSDNGSGGGGDGGGTESAIPIDACTTDPTTPVEGDVIKLGSTFPQSGLYATFAEISKGYTAYFDYVNDNGGVDGKSIELVTYDDEYLPDKTVANAERLVQEDDVFALFNVVGTANVSAIRDTLGADCVPNLYAATGSQLWGQAEDYPWTIGSIPAYPTEAAVFATYLEEENPEAKVAILYQADDFGEGYLDAFKTSIEGTGIEVVAEEALQPGGQPNSGITTLAASGADTLMLAVTTTTCPGALGATKDTGWEPLVYISATCSSEVLMGLAPEGSKDNVITSVYIKAPTDPTWAEDEAIVEYRELGAEYGLSEEDLDDGLVTYGWAMGELMTRTLEQAAEGGELTRLSVMEAARSLEQLEIGVLLPGVTATSNGVEDPFVIEAMQVGKYDPAGKYFVLEGEVTDFEGRTGDYIG